MSIIFKKLIYYISKIILIAFIILGIVGIFVGMSTADLFMVVFYFFWTALAAFLFLRIVPLVFQKLFLSNKKDKVKNIPVLYQKYKKFVSQEEPAQSSNNADTDNLISEELQIKKTDSSVLDKSAKPSQKHKSIKPHGIPSGRFVKQMTISPVGITFECRKDRNIERQDVLFDLKEGDIVEVEKYKYKRKDAYMLIGQDTGLDFGVINASLAEEFSERYQNNRIEGYVSKRDNFYSDNDDYEGNFGLIETCRVKLYILE